MIPLLHHFKAAPLSSGFLLASIMGFLASILYVWRLNPSFGFSFAVIFAAMFIASLIAMNHAPVEHELAMDHHASKSGRR